MRGSMSAPQELLPGLADLLDAAPGPTGNGLSSADRAAIYCAIDTPSHQTWRQARRVHITKNDLLYVAVLHHTNVTLLEIPTAEQLLTAIEQVIEQTEKTA